MLLAVSSTGKNLSDQIDPRFGRCSYFLIVDINTMEFEIFDNESIAMGGGAGIQSAQFIASKHVNTVITGNCGPNAVRTLQAAGVELVVGQTGSIDEVIEKYKAGLLKMTAEPNVSDHYGMGRKNTGEDSQNQDTTPIMEHISMGRGEGTGRGRGNRCGRGMGKGLGRAGGSIPRATTSKESSTIPKNKEMKELKEQIKILEGQLNSIATRIEGLGN